MDYQQSVAMAPAGWTHFRIGDLDRLPPAVKAREMARVPASEREQLANGDSDAVVGPGMPVLYWVVGFFFPFTFSVRAGPRER